MVVGALKCSGSASGSVSILGVTVGISKREVAAVLVGGSSPLTRDRVVAQALKVIAQEGAGMLTMRTLAARLGVVPGVLYRHGRELAAAFD
jgi:hypothetical protein